MLFFNFFSGVLQKNLNLIARKFLNYCDVIVIIALMQHPPMLKRYKFLLSLKIFPFPIFFTTRNEYYGRNLKCYIWPHISREGRSYLCNLFEISWLLLIYIYHIHYWFKSFRSINISHKLKMEKNSMHDEPITLEIEFNYIMNFAGSSINSPLTDDTAIRNPVYSASRLHHTI